MPIYCGPEELLRAFGPALRYRMSGRHVNDEFLQGLYFHHLKNAQYINPWIKIEQK
jgi:hypothetical protein